MWHVLLCLGWVSLMCVTVMCVYVSLAYNTGGNPCVTGVSLVYVTGVYHWCDSL